MGMRMGRGRGGRWRRFVLLRLRVVVVLVVLALAEMTCRFRCMMCTVHLKICSWRYCEHFPSISLTPNDKIEKRTNLHPHP
jgi:hypothetical protein